MLVFRKFIVVPTLKKHIFLFFIGYEVQFRKFTLSFN